MGSTPACDPCWRNYCYIFLELGSVELQPCPEEMGSLELLHNRERFLCLVCSEKAKSRCRYGLDCFKIPAYNSPGHVHWPTLSSKVMWERHLFVTRVEAAVLGCFYLVLCTAREVGFPVVAEP